METLKSRGLDTHEEVTSLEIHVDQRNMLVSVASPRLWRLKQGHGWALRCRTFPWLRRDVLSVSLELHKFTRVCYGDPARLWPSARAEARTFIGFLPSIVSSWTRGLVSSMVATGASEPGFDICLKKCEKTTSENIGRTSERA